jgi:hypothetical protein
MERLTNRFDRISTRRNLIITLIVTIATVSVMGYATQVLVYDVYGDFSMPDTRFGYEYDDLVEAFGSLGEEGLQMWSQVHLLDLIFPLGYSFAMLIGITMELRAVFPDDRKLRALSIVPLFGAIADYLENALVASQVAAYPNLSPAVVSIASFVTITKWILLGIGFAIVLLLPIVWIGKRMRR